MKEEILSELKNTVSPVNVIVIDKQKWVSWYSDSYEQATDLLSKYMDGWKVEDIKTMEDYLDVCGYLCLEHVLNYEQAKDLFDEDGEIDSVPETKTIIMWL